MSLKLNSSGGGSVTVQEPVTASNRTLNLPDVDATVLTDSAGVLNIGSGQVYKDASGNVGIGQTPTAYGSTVRNVEAYIAGASGFTLVSAATASVKTEITSGESALIGQVGTRTNHPLALKVNDAERARIDSSGNLLVGTTTSTGGSGNVRIEGTGGLYITNIPTTSTAGNCLISSGEGNRFYRSTSSLKYKRNVVDMQRGIADVQQLRPVNFNGVSDFDGDKLFAGFIAEEVEALNFKEFVIYDENGEPDGLQYANMVALLTKAIQEQQQMIETLQAKVAALEAK